MIKEQAKAIMTTKNDAVRAKHKKALRQFLQQVKQAMNRAQKPGEATAAEMRGVEDELSSLLADLSLSPAERQEKARLERQKQQEAEAEAAELATSSSSNAESAALLSPSQRAVLESLMREERLNPHDPSKPYATPWSPRDWMAPFAFIPRYLEVNQRICAAVYLRHPVARPGRTEVPTPFPPALSQLAFNWYLRRR